LTGTDKFFHNKIFSLVLRAKTEHYRPNSSKSISGHPMFLEKYISNLQEKNIK